MELIEPFVVKHYASEDRPVIKGNGFDGLEIGEDREEAQRFVEYVNELLKDATAWRTLVASADSAAVHVVGQLAVPLGPHITARVRAFPVTPVNVPMFENRNVKQAVFRWVAEQNTETLRDALLNLAGADQ